MRAHYFFLILFIVCNFINAFGAEKVSLNGTWEKGYNREYFQKVELPSVTEDPKKSSSTSLWFRKRLKLPKTDWNKVQIELNGARFSPKIYINQTLVANLTGGMAPIRTSIKHSDLEPSKEVTIEIELQGLDKIASTDASKIPPADFWRSNISSCIWDDINLYFSKDIQIDQFYAFLSTNSDSIKFKYALEGNIQNSGYSAIISIPSIKFQSSNFKISKNQDIISIPIQMLGVQFWSPDKPNVYHIQLQILSKKQVLDERILKTGIKQFKTKGLHFELNQKPVHLRAVSVVWHRWIRDPEATQLAFDTTWFVQNIISRMKSLGANTLRFHLGMPPESFLQLCDRYGLMVQAEWSFFHGMKASKESLYEQWNRWFDLCMKHPSVVILHGWNETEEENELKTAFEAIEQVAQNYPPLVIGHRDVLHIHKYWWSMFENVGCYYDSIQQFSMPIMVDEFGGNYLDGNYNVGAYPALKGSFLRFLGENHSKEDRIWLQNISAAKIAEYWRLLGAAGYSPFCALGSPEDGNHWFEGPLKDAKPKPVWSALSSAYAPVAAILQLWDKNFLPGSQVSVPIHFFNDTDSDQLVKTQILLYDSNDSSSIQFQQNVSVWVKAHQREKTSIDVHMPSVNGTWTLDVLTGSSTQSNPIISSWTVCTHKPIVPNVLKKLNIGLRTIDSELGTFLKQNGCKVCALESPTNDIVLLNQKDWNLYIDDLVFRKQIEKLVVQGVKVIQLDAGENLLGEGYFENGKKGNLQASHQVKNPFKKTYDLPLGVQLTEVESAEPESHIHAREKGKHLWYTLKKEQTWLWNGLKGGIIVPATEWNIEGLNSTSFLSYWSNKGADAKKINQGQYYAYELQGFYAFSEKEKDSDVQKQLRAKVIFLVEDAPALKNKINPNAPIAQINLNEGYLKSKTAKAKNINAMVCAGKNLTKNVVYSIDYNGTNGSYLISQLRTQGRLVKRFEDIDTYQIRYDPVAVQMILNLMAETIRVE